MCSVQSRRRQERWKYVPSYKGYYEVSDHGRIRSLERTVFSKEGRPRFVTEKIRKLKPGTYGYIAVTLSKHGKKRTFSVHRLVLLAFIGKCPRGLEGCHNDGDKTNNYLSNLRYDTPKNNHADKKLHGTNNSGSRQGNSKLIEKDVLAIRSAYTYDSKTTKQLAENYKVSVTTIRLIVRRKTWKHIGGADCSTMLKKRKREGSAKLTIDRVREMRNLHEEGWTYTDLGEEFGVSKNTVYSIITHRTWKEV